MNFLFQLFTLNLKVELYLQFLMTDIEDNDDFFSTFSKDTEDKLDVIKLEPQTIRKVTKWPLIFIIPSIIAIIITIVFYEGVEYAILLMVESFFFLVGLLVFSVERKRFSSDKNTYTFTNEGLKIESKAGTDKFTPWEQISNIKIKGLYSKDVGAKRCEITTSYGDRIIIKLNWFIETTEDVMYPHITAKMIQKYYDRMKE